MSATKMVESVQATIAEDDMVVKDVKEEVAWERKEKRKKRKKKSGGRTTLTFLQRGMGAQRRLATFSAASFVYSGMISVCCFFFVVFCIPFKFVLDISIERTIINVRLAVMLVDGTGKDLSIIRQVDEAIVIAGGEPHA